MRHRKSGIKLNRTTSHRDAMFRNMVTSLFKHDRIKTTDAKAKELRKWADHLVTLAKKGDLHARRQALSIMREKDVVHQLFETVEDRFGNASGGYTRIVKLGFRPGDAASTSLIELVTSEQAESKSKKKRKKKAKKTESPETKTESAVTETDDTVEAKEKSDSDEPDSVEIQASKQDEKAPEESAVTEFDSDTPESGTDSEKDKASE